jgi:hypothetical protein
VADGFAGDDREEALDLVQRGGGAVGRDEAHVAPRTRCQPSFTLG